MPGVYGGDDVSAIVLDAGSSLLRAGWAGEDTPRIVIPSSYGWLPDESNGTGSEAPASTEAQVAADGDVSMVDAGAEATSATENGEANGAEQPASSTAAPALSEAMDSRTRIAKYTAKKAEGKGGKKRKYYFGDSGVNQWRQGMEISPTVVDGVGESSRSLRRGTSADH